MASAPGAPGAASVRVWHITSRGWDPWTERPLPEVVRVAYPQTMSMLWARVMAVAVDEAAGRAA